MAFLRCDDGLWLLGVNYMALCDNCVAQIRWGRGLLGISALREWPPVTGWEGRLRVDISATLCWPFPWCDLKLALLLSPVGTK